MPWIFLFRGLEAIEGPPEGALVLKRRKGKSEKYKKKGRHKKKARIPKDKSPVLLLGTQLTFRVFVSYSLIVYKRKITEQAGH